MADQQPNTVAAEMADSSLASYSTVQMAVGSKLASRCASLLAYILLHVEVPAVVRLASKCAQIFFKLVDLQKINMFQASPT